MIVFIGLIVYIALLSRTGRVQSDEFWCVVREDDYALWLEGVCHLTRTQYRDLPKEEKLELYNRYYR